MIPPKLLEKIKRLLRSQPALVEQGQDIIDDYVLSLSKQVRLREGRFWSIGKQGGYHCHSGPLAGQVPEQTKQKCWR